MPSKDSSGHAYTSLPLEDIFSTSEDEFNRLPSTPPPHFDEGTSFENNPTNHNMTSDEFSEIKRNIEEINNMLSLLNTRTGGFDPERLSSKAEQDKRCERTCFKVFLSFVVVIICIMLVVWFSVYLSIWYVRSTHNIS
ncbi:hypothetical protein DFJ63DRAFT_314873 [Scheffersomyces coipomensis]|uniref:uncharacterized protein n=1 Tax=Scheffersomyces coipomensis TaxID=1788519 RepID=UPI00315D54D4